MLAALLLSLTASAGGSPLVAWEIDRCPPETPAADAKSRLAQAQARADCFHRGMLAELAAPAAAGLRADQPRFERWANVACWLSGELSALELSPGRVVSTEESELLPRICLQSAWAERGFLAANAATFDPQAPPGKNPFSEVVLSRQAMGAGNRLELAKLLGALRDPAQAAGLSAKDREAFVKSIDMVWQGALELAQRECDARREGSLCVARLESYYFSLVNPYPGGRAPGQGG